MIQNRHKKRIYGYDKRVTNIRNEKLYLQYKM